MPFPNHRSTSKWLSKFVSIALSISVGTGVFINPPATADSNETSSSSANAGAQGRISAGGDFTCVVTNVGAAKCWGRNSAGNLGDTTTVDRNIPIQVSGLTTGVASITTGYKHACALLETGAVKCWGYNYFGQTGDGNNSDVVIPTSVSTLSSGVTAISAGSYHTCALLNTGAVKCWGYNALGQLGDGSTVSKSFPTNVTGLTNGVIAIGSGNSHSCALLNTGAVKCWGLNNNGALGDGTWVSKLIPTQVSGLLSGVTGISVSYLATCAVLSNGSAKCWGNNVSGQLGDGSTNDSNIPVQVSGLTSDVEVISGGDLFACAMQSTGTVKCWGRNYTGQLGNNSTIDVSTPVQVFGLSSGVAAMTSGEAHSCALLYNGNLNCWGNNWYGAIGDGTSIDRLVPTNVSSLSTSVGPTTTTTTTTLPPTTTTVAPVSSTTTQAPTTTVANTTPSPSSTVSPTPSTTSPLVNNVATAPPTPLITTTPASNNNSTTTPSSSSSSSSSSTSSTTSTTIPLSAEISEGNTTAIASALKKNPAAETSVYINGKKTKAKVTRTANNIIVTVAGTNTKLSATAPDGTSINITADGVLEVKHGSQVSTATAGFAPYSSVESWCYSTPTKLGTETTDGIGETQARYEITTQISAGSHHLVIRGTNSNSQSVTIGFAMRVIEDSLITRIAASPVVWVILLLALLLAVFIPGRLRRNGTQ